MVDEPEPAWSNDGAGCALAFLFVFAVGTVQVIRFGLNVLLSILGLG